MSASSTCSQCLRILRQVARAKKNIQVPYRIPTSSRSLSTSSSRWQEQRQVPDPEPFTQPPPVTTGTVTSNVTAAPPNSTPPASNAPSKKEPKMPNLSTSEMQRQINSSLGQPRAASFTMNIAQKLRKTAKSTTESYITYGLTEAFFKSCSAQVQYSIPEEQRNRILTDKGPPKTAEGEDLGVAESDTWWFKELGLEPTFSTWSQVTYLHMYLLTVRLRAMEDRSAFTNYQRYLIEHFSNDAEDKMIIFHNMNARGIRNKYLKDLFIQWRGLLAAYDEGLAKGDAVLAGAVWRNLWKGSEDVDWEKVAAVVAYMRKAINRLGQVDLDDLAHNLDKGASVWSSSKPDLRTVGSRKSKGINEVAP